MIHSEDIKRMTSTSHLTPDQARRITNAENTCKSSTTDWSKNFWYGVLEKLCRKYDAMDYFRKASH
jgi:hypothetical protein